MPTPPEQLRVAIESHAGADFHTFALQVNPWGYVDRTDKKTSFDNGEDYERALVDALRDSGVEAIAITDHDRIPPGSLVERAAEAGITVFPGFEARTSENIHVLCLFDPTRPQDEVMAVLNALIEGEGQMSDKPLKDVARLVNDRDGVMIAAHATTASGLLNVLHGEARISAWKDEKLSAVAIPGRPSDLEAGYRAIVTGEEIAYRRQRGPAIVNANDIWDPSQVAKDGSLTRLKMSTLTIDGLRHAFMDPGSRVRLMDEQYRSDHAELLGIYWEGGFMDGLAIGFSENINVIIGGRGAGKSSLLRSIRFALDQDAHTEPSAADQETFEVGVLGPGTTVWLALRTFKPTEATYVIKRTVGDSPKVETWDGETIDVPPRALGTSIEFFAQHELSEVARDKRRHGNLVTRYIDNLADLNHGIEELQKQLVQNREQLEALEKEVADANARLGALPAKKLQLEKYQESGLEENLGRKPILERERRGLERAERILSDYGEHIVGFGESNEIDANFLTDLSEGGGPTAEIFEQLENELVGLRGFLTKEGPETLRAKVEQVRETFDSLRDRWQRAEKAELEAIQAELREVGAEGQTIDHFLRLDEQIDALEELEAESRRTQQQLETLRQERDEIRTRYVEARAARDQAFVAAAGQAVASLPKLVRVTARPHADLADLKSGIRDLLGGRLHEAEEELEGMADEDAFDPEALISACRSGPDALEDLGFNNYQATKFSEGGNELVRLLEEADIQPLVRIELNTSREDQETRWRELPLLSTGQKATALLLLALAETADDGPLIIDQPEEDLDAGFLVEGVIERLRQGKTARQFFFATHNPNIPVLADAELVMALSATGEAGDEGATVQIEAIGSIDDESVRSRVADLDGGKVAFNIRRARYGF